jgi:hypothetical protein
VLFAGGAFAQTSSLTGVVADPSGSVIAGAAVELESTTGGTRRSVTTGPDGSYTFSQIAPGNYKLTVKSQGFTQKVFNDVRLLVNQPATLNVTLEVGAITESISVAGGAAQVNTVDASLGNAIGEKPILQLPFEGRNVVGLLALQPGVTFISEPNPGTLNDYRSGAVNGGRSDQANVTLDGVDVNDQQDRAAFTSVLRVTLDSTQEFRTTTTNAGAEQGRSSGAQVTLVTKSGTNTFHGSAYEFHRNTITSANDFFSNKAGVPRQRLIRNVYGASLGGPIKKDRLFFFVNYEGRKDRSDGQALRIVPDAEFRNGFFDYITTAGTTARLTPEQVRAQDPAGIGPSPAVLTYFRSFPLPNDLTVGDQLNTSGFRFNGATPLNWATYIAKFDWNIDAAGKYTMFFRGNLQNDNFARLVPQFPGEPNNQVFLENSKGYAIGANAVIFPTLISTTRFGFTRQGTETTGLQQAPAATLRDLDNRFGLTRALVRIAPVYTLTQDFAWTKGKHSITFGGVLRDVVNQRRSTLNSFSSAFGNSSWLLGTGGQFFVPGAANRQPYRRQFSNLLGILSQLTRQANYNLDGSLFPEGARIPRQFGNQEYEMYIQDSWKVTKNLTITAGLRYSFGPPIEEEKGFQTSPNVPLGEWFDQRGGLGFSGRSQALAPKLSFDLASKTGVGLYDYFKNWQPRVALAYAKNNTVVRAGFGIYYDLVGQGLARLADATALGFSSSISNPATASPVTSPRFTGFFNVPLDRLPAAPRGGFPQVQPDIFQITNSVDSGIKAPYTMNMNLSIGHEFANGFFIQGSYVGRLSRRTLIRDDVAMPTNLVDPASGQSYFEAARILGQLAINDTPVRNVPRLPFWENMWPGAAGNGLTATQAIYQQYLDNSPDFTTALAIIDTECFPACSRLGPFAMFNSQYSALFALRSRGGGSYNGFQFTTRKRFSQGYQFDFNYTWSKSIDLASGREGEGAFFGGTRNSFRPGDMKGVSDYDTTHLFSFLGVAELPFGKGKKWAGNANRFLDALVGGWQVSGLWRQSSGFPLSILNDGGWPTNWQLFSWANQTAPNGGTGSFKNVVGANGRGSGPNVFANPVKAYGAYTFSLPGDTGQRNGVRGDGVFTIDVGLGKRFHLFSLKDNPHTIQIRAEAFNVTNSVRFDVNSINNGITNQAVFGQYTNVLVRPRVIQFAARYEF